MNLFDKAIGYVAPGLAVKRVLNRERLSYIKKQRLKQRSFEAISGGRTRYDFLKTSESPDSAIANSIQTLRQSVRQLEYNNGYVAGAIQRIRDNVVGHGIRFQARLKEDAKGIVPKINQTGADRFNAEIERVFKIWQSKADIRLNNNLFEIQSLVEGALLRDNECVVVGRNSNRPDRLLPYCLELFECDRLQTPRSEINNPKIRHGIEYDNEGVPKFYYMLKVHPGETLTLASKRDDFEQIRAFNANGTRKVYHLFHPLRPEQTRGFTKWAAALKDVQDLERYLDAEKLATLQDACTVGIHYNRSPKQFSGNFTTNSDNDDYDRIFEFAPGANYRLHPDDKFEIHRPTRPNNQFGDYVDNLLRGVASALNVPAEIVHQNWKQFNFSNARTVLLQFYLTCRIRQAYLVYHLLGPIYENVLAAAKVKGLVQAPLYFQRESDYRMAHAWIPPGWQWVDPLKEAQGKQTELENNTDTLTDICASKGKDVEEVIETRAREKAYMAKMEEKYGVDLTAPPRQPPNMQDEPEEDEQNEQKSILSIIRN